MKETAKIHKIEYPVAADDDGATFKAFKADSYPDYYLIDRKGNLLWVISSTATSRKPFSWRSKRNRRGSKVNL